MDLQPSAELMRALRCCICTTSSDVACSSSPISRRAPACFQPSLVHTGIPDGVWCSEISPAPGAGKDACACTRQGFASEGSGPSTSGRVSEGQWSTSRASSAAAEPLGAAADSSAGTAGPEQQTLGSRVMNIVGNSLLAGLLGGTAFFGYYQLRYDVHELAQLVEDTHTAEGGPLQQVCCCQPRLVR